MRDLAHLCSQRLRLIAKYSPAVTVAFTLVDDPKTSFIAWTTTPWTMPSNLALCVHPELSYIKIHDVERDHNYILCDKLLTCLYKDPAKAKKEKKYEVLETYKGTDLAGKEYVPLFPYFKERVSPASHESSRSTGLN